jgi:hypothetical protein
MQPDGTNTFGGYSDRKSTWRERRRIYPRPRKRTTHGASARRDLHRRSGDEETQEILDFCAEHGIKSEVEVIPIDRINEAFDDIVAGTVRYRYVIDTASSESEVTID